MTNDTPAEGEQAGLTADPIPLLERATQEGTATGFLHPTSVAEAAARLSKNDRRARVEIQERLRELHADASRSGEPFSPSSLADLTGFVESIIPLTHRPSIFLLDNGNLRAVWRNAAKEQVALQFLGQGVVQFVIFIQRQQPPMMSRTAGTDALANIRARIIEGDCARLIFG